MIGNLVCDRFLGYKRDRISLPCVVDYTGDGGHFKSIADIPCPKTHFACPDGVCLPYFMRYNTVADCIGHMDCNFHTCPDSYRCACTWTTCVTVSTSVLTKTMNCYCVTSSLVQMNVCVKIIYLYACMLHFQYQPLSFSTFIIQACEVFTVCYLVIGMKR